jgi:hypothetical protein
VITSQKKTKKKQSSKANNLMSNDGTKKTINFFLRKKVEKKNF